MSRRILFSVAGAAAVALLAGCGSGGGSTAGARQSPVPLPPPAPSSTREVGPFRLELDTNQTVYRKGQPVTLRMRVTNLTAEAVTVRYSVITRIKWAVDFGGRNVADSGAIPGVVVDEEVVYAPGESRSYDFMWDQYAGFPDPATGRTISPDYKAIPGDYQISAWLTGNTSPPEPDMNGRPGLITAPLTIRIEE
jgi:hypothetical protein